MKWDPKDQVTMFDLMPNAVDSKRKETDEPDEPSAEEEPAQKPNN